MTWSSSAGGVDSVSREVYWFIHIRTTHAHKDGRSCNLTKSFRNRNLGLFLCFYSFFKFTLCEVISSWGVRRPLVSHVSIRLRKHLQNKHLNEQRRVWSGCLIHQQHIVLTEQILTGRAETHRRMVLVCVMNWTTNTVRPHLKWTWRQNTTPAEQWL